MSFPLYVKNIFLSVCFKITPSENWALKAAYHKNYMKTRNRIKAINNWTSLFHSAGLLLKKILLKSNIGIWLAILLISIRIWFY